MTNYPLIKPLTDEQINSGVRMLENNRKEATHAIIAWWDVYKPSEWRSSIDELDYKINFVHRSMDSAHVVAIFKIREK